MKGTTVGHYRVLDRIGGGGMGVVHEAEDTRLGRRVALKFLPPDLATDMVALSRFRREARAASALNHPHICTLHDIAEEEGQVFLVMERLEGSSVKDVLSQEGLPIARVLDIGVQIADALEAAHAKGIVHRDIKPSNLWLTTRGDVKVLDFGLAKRARARELAASDGDTATEDRDVTNAGAAVGTLGYMSPEQARGEEVDGRSDLFSLGAVLYEMATGKAAFPGKTTAVVLDAVLNREPVEAEALKTTLPAGFGAIVGKALEKDRALRYQTASDLKADLLRLKRSLEPKSTSLATDVAGRAPRGAVERRGRQRRVVGGVAAALVGAGAWLLGHPPPMPRITNVTPLHLDPGWLSDSGLSSTWATDGVRLYFVKWKQDEYGLFQVPVAGGEASEIEIPSRLRRGLEIYGFLPRQSALLCLTVPDSSGAGWPVWTVPVPKGTPRRLGDLVANTAAVSSDGERIFLLQSDTRRLLSARIDGSDLQAVTDTPARPAWVRSEPHGNLLRFSAAGPPGHEGEEWIWETSVGGATPRPLYPGRRGNWTPDGRDFAVERWTDSTSRLDAFIVREAWWPRWTGSQPVQLTSGPVSFIQLGPRPDKKGWFAFGSDRRAELLRFDRELGRFEPFLGGSSVGYVDPSPDGQWLAWISFPDEVLWQGRRDGGASLQLTTSPLRAWMPRWSPDGKQILFVSRAPGEPERAVRVVPAGGGAIEVLARPEKGLDLWDPCWLPDGRSIVFGSMPWDSTSRLRVLNWTTREVSTLPGSQGLNGPKCGPQGQILATRAGLSGQPLVVRWPDHEQWEEVPPAPSRLMYPTWTHGGRSFCGLGQSDNRIHCYSFNERRYTTLADLGHTRLLPWVVAPWMGLDLDDSPMVMQDVSSMDLYALDWEAP